jgi:hypothetical protein
MIKAMISVMGGLFSGVLVCTIFYSVWHVLNLNIRDIESSDLMLIMLILLPVIRFCFWLGAADGQTNQEPPAVR